MIGFIMRLHTNTLTSIVIYQALHACKQAGTVDRLVDFEDFDHHRSMSRNYAYEIQLGWYGTKVKGDGRRFKNSGAYGSSHVYAATYEEWGHFILALFELDPDLTFGPYKSLESFHSQTRYAFGD
jgi:hypothetical protein